MTLRAVLDTNIVLSALVFSAGRLSWVRHAWQRDQIRPIVCRETVGELLRVLAYPKFGLSPGEQQSLIEDFLPYAEVFTSPTAWPSIPECRDGNDKVFLALTISANATSLITSDADLLALRNAFPGRVLSADEFATRMQIPLPST